MSNADIHIDPESGTSSHASEHIPSNGTVAEIPNESTPSSSESVHAARDFDAPQATRPASRRSATLESASASPTKPILLEFFSYAEYQLGNTQGARDGSPTVLLRRLSDGSVVIDFGHKIFVREKRSFAIDANLSAVNEGHLVQLADVHQEWKSIVNSLSKQLAFAGREILTPDEGSSPGRILRLLSNVSEAADQLDVDSAYLRRFSEQLPDLMKQEEMARASAVKEMISTDLVKKVDSLFLRASSIMSIDEAYKARTQNASMKRLSWITFVFLPLVFIASLFGMNVDILDGNPSWKFYFALAVPTFAVIMAVVLIWKYGISYWRRTLQPKFFKRDRTESGYHLLQDLEASAHHQPDPDWELHDDRSILKQLVKACNNGNVEIAKRIIRAYPDMDISGALVKLSYDSPNLNARVVEVLCAAGAVPTYREDYDYGGITPIMMVAIESETRESPGILKALLDAHTTKMIDERHRDEHIYDSRDDPDYQYSRLYRSDVGHTDRDRSENAGYGFLTALGLTVHHNRIEHGRVLVQHGYKIAAREDRERYKYGASRDEVEVMVYACGHGTLQYVEMLISENIPITSTPDFNYSPLQVAVKYSRADTISKLLSLGALDHEGSEGRYNLLHMAAHNGPPEIMDMLVDAGSAEVSPKDRDSPTSSSIIHFAVKHSDVEVVEKLLSLGALEHETSERRSALLHLATKTLATANWTTGKLAMKIIRMLVGAGIDVDSLDTNGVTPLARVVSDERFYEAGRRGISKYEAVWKLVELGAYLGPFADEDEDGTPARIYIDAQDRLDTVFPGSRNEALRIAVTSEQYRIAEILLGIDKATINRPRAPGNETALHIAVSWRARFPTSDADRQIQLGVVRNLIDKGVDVNARDSRKYTPLYVATMNGDLEVMEVLLRNGALPNLLKEDGSMEDHQPLHLVSNWTEAVEILLLHGSNPDAPNALASGSTALHRAAHAEDNSTVRALLDGGASVSARNDMGRGAIHYALPDAEAIRTLVEAGADVNSRDNNSWTPLHVYSCNGKPKSSEQSFSETLQLLIDNGVDINAFGQVQETPLHLAVRCGDQITAKELFKAGAELLPDASGAVVSYDEETDTFSISNANGPVEYPDLELLDPFADPDDFINSICGPGTGHLRKRRETSTPSDPPENKINTGGQLQSSSSLNADWDRYQSRHLLP